jgi:hypothetical protein
MPLHQFRVSLTAGEPAALLRAVEPHTGPWHMHHLEPEKGYVGAVAYDGTRRALRTWPLMGAEEVPTGVVRLTGS